LYAGKKAVSEILPKLTVSPEKFRKKPRAILFLPRFYVKQNHISGRVDSERECKLTLMLINRIRTTLNRQEKNCGNAPSILNLRRGFATATPCQPEIESERVNGDICGGTSPRLA